MDEYDRYYNLYMRTDYNFAMQDLRIDSYKNIYYSYHF